MSMSWSQLSGTLANNSLIQGIPLIGEFELTARCNLGCKMCYICKNASDKTAINNERTAKEWIHLAREAFDSGMLFLLLTGGEVFLRNDFKTIYEELAMMGFNITIYTNATLVTPEIAAWLGNIAPSQIDVTLYGASRETYGRICGDPSAYNRAIEGINLLRNQGINVQIRTTIVRDNVDDYEKLEEIAESYGLNLGIVNYISPRRDENGCMNDAIRLSPKELIEFEDRVNRYYKTKEKNKALEQEKVLNQLEAHTNLNIFHRKENAFPCNSGKNAFWITWYGSMVPCSLLNHPSTKPMEEGFLKAWKRLQKLCAKVPSCKSCNSCKLHEFCISCPANLYNETGGFKQPSNYLCELAKARAIRYHSKNIQQLK